MEQDEIVLEDGELSDASDTYTPLERPLNYAASQPNARFPVPQESESETEVQSTDSDSDSDNSNRNRKKSKKPKIKLKPKLQLNPKRKKYDIWSTRVQEDVLAETLNSCDVSKKDRSRDVESYDYLGRRHHFMDVRTSNKRTRDDRRNFNLKSRGRSKSQEKVKSAPRDILELNVTPDSSMEDIAREMANKLYEEKEDLILRVLGAVGSEKCFSLFKETKKIEGEGGMLILNQTRRRTPGGVFLFLVRHDDEITPEQKDSIFLDEKEKQKTKMRNKQKKKMMKMKDQREASQKKLLPDLLTRAELLANESNRERKQTEDTDVINPPPTPETDCHENSGDGMDGPIFPHVNGVESDEKRKVESYDDDFLDLGCSNDMDLF